MLRRRRRRRRRRRKRRRSRRRRRRRRRAFCLRPISVTPTFFSDKIYSTTVLSVKTV
jgi:hypothetical protein